MRVRLKDIAKDLNLSKMTISKVLRGQTDISDATKARVMQRVRELNYIPNISASSLRTGQTRTMGLILPSIGSRYLEELTDGITQALHAENYSLIVSSSQAEAASEQRQIAVFLSLQVDALLVVSLQETAAFFEQMQNAREVPVIFVGTKPTDAPGTFVGIHEEEVGRIACEHLVQCGCRRIAYIRGSHSAVGDRRSNGYRQALSRHQIAVQADLVVESMDPEESEYARGFAAMERLLKRRGRPDGVMTFTDLLAVGAMDAASQHGVRIPEEMRFVGCGNDPALCAMRIPLTSIDIAGGELGERAGKLALRAIQNGGGNGSNHVLVKPRLVKRQSSEGAH
jgi:LacI family transcriptional regulator